MTTHADLGARRERHILSHQTALPTEEEDKESNQIAAKLRHNNDHELDRPPKGGGVLHDGERMGKIGHGIPLAAGELFPTVKAALASTGSYGVGASDPRILWTSDPLPAGVVGGSLAPLLDPETGMLYSGQLTQKTTKVVAALDPKVSFLVDRGDGKLSEVKGIVPLGVAPPAGGLLAPGPNASLGAFRVQVTLPGGMVDSTAGTLPLAVESQRVAGVPADQTPQGFARSVLRVTRPDGTAEVRPASGFGLQREIPPGMEVALRRQRGFNKFLSPWIVAVADPRAATEYQWPAGADKASLGCASCDRPLRLQGAVLNTAYFEIFTTGSYLGVHPDLGSLSSAGYGYLTNNGRLSASVTAVPGDLVRPSDGASALDKVAARDLPTAGTGSEQVAALNTGEVQRGATDLAISGRGIDFTLQRFYSSAVANVGPFGRNLDSPLFARIRRLPNGDVAFYDGTGRRDVFTGGVTPPAGVFLAMSTALEGSILVQYPDNTRLYFDAYGRLSKMTDRNATKADGSDGNAMRLFYRQDGKLDSVVDPTDRVIHFDYFAGSASGGFEGCISKVTDFDNRVVSYSYDGVGRLTKVDGPDPESANSAKPTTTYTWGPSPTSGSKQQLYTSGQLASEQDGLSRTIWSVGYDTTNRWAASSLTSGGGTWSFTLNPDNTSVLDANGHAWQYFRDTDNHISSMKDPASAVTTYSFDTAKRLASVTRPLGDATTYGYASASSSTDLRPMANVTTVTEKPRTGSDEAAAHMTHVTQIGYGPANLAASITTPDGATTTIVRDTRGNPQTTTDPAGVTSTTTYDTFGLLRSSSDPRNGSSTYAYYAGSQAGYLKAITTSAGTITYSVDSRGNATLVTDASGKNVTYKVNKIDQVEGETKGGSQSTMSYDATGEVVSKQILAGVDSLGNPIFRQLAFSVDEVGRLRQRSDNGQLMTFGYDPKGNLQTVSRTGKPPATFGYDARDRFTTETVGTQTTTYGYDDDGSLARLTNARGKTTTYVTSGFAESIGDISPIAVLTAQTTDAAGRPVDTKILKKTPDGKTLILRWSKAELDPLGRVRREIRKLFTDPLVLPADGSDPVGATDVVTQTIYDDAANKVTVIDPRGNATVSQMDDLGRLVSVTDAVGNVMQYEYDANGNKHAETMTEVSPDGLKETSRSVFEYDDQNRLITKTDVTNPAAPLTTRSSYDAQGNLVSETDPDGQTTTFEYDLRRRMTKKTAPEGGVTKYEYDDADRLQTITDANGNQTKFTYDTNGNQQTEQRADGATWTYTYDENFNRKTVTDPNGTVVTFVYDDAERLIEKQIAKGTNVLGPSHITMTLDDLGRTTATATDEGVNETMTYDSLDRQLSESLQIGTGPSRTFNRSFDPSGNLSGLVYPSGLHLTHDIDQLDRIAAIRDAAAPLTPIVTYSDIGGRLSSKTLANGARETWTYDPNRRLAEILSKAGVATLRDVQYQRSHAGDKLAAIRPDLQKQSTYTYNRNHWMTSESLGIPLTGPNPQPLQTASYDFDNVLNTRSVTRTATDANGATTSTSTAFGINARNQYPNAGSETLSYDRNGNLRGRTGLTIQYDYENRLSKAVLANGTIVENLHDAGNRKVEEKITAGAATHTTDYALSGDQVKEEYVDGALARRYINGREIDEIVRADVSNTTVYPLQDELGSVERLMDASGATVERYEYEGYGQFHIFDAANLEHSASTVGWKSLFQSREYQASLGSFDFRARTLWPDLGRFGQEDPAKAHPGESPYQAFLASPISLSDPTGKYEEDVHHYLTIFLAHAAGFSRATSASLGYETGHLDFDERDAMYGGRNFVSWELYHFVSPGRLNEMRRIIMADDVMDSRQVGEYLHAVQDSYSHQTNPNRREFGANFALQSHAGHALRGHDPDLTWKRQGLAMLMAEETYRQTRALCDHFGLCGTAEPFDGNVRKKVAAFNAYMPGTFLDQIDGLDVETVCDYGLKVKILDRTFEIALFERQPREAKYRQMLERLHVTQAYAGRPCGQ